MKRLFLIITAFSMILTLQISAEGDETVELLRSPDILASGGSYTSTLSPMSDMINPAASALQQRLSFNVNAASLFSDDTVTGYNGTAFNLGAALPLRVGVVTAGVYLLGTDPGLAELYTDFQGGFRAGFSKELYPELLAGMAINTVFGESWGLSVDIGFIKNEDDYGIMKNIQWGAVLGELGYSGFANQDAPSVFTPGAGISFDLIEGKDLDFRVNGDLSFPTCSNIRLNLGANVNFFDFAGLQFSSTADLRELAGIDDGFNDLSGLIPAFGLYFNFKTNIEDEDFANRGWSQNDLKVSASASPMRNGLWAVSAGANAQMGVIGNTAPQIEPYLSEFLDDENTDGAVETDDKSEADVDSAEVSSISKTAGKSVALKKGVLKSRNFVADDNEKITAGKINRGNINQGPNGERIIKYISPNNDGIKDIVEIPVRISDSRYIKGFSFIIEDENGQEVKRIENKEKRPENTGLANFFQRLFYVEKGVDIPEKIRWDGIGDNGEVVPDGYYSFYMEAWDDNGNKSATDRYGLVVDNTPPQIVIEEIDAEQKIFSPNNDGNKDSLTISQTGSSEDKWSGEIKSSDGNVYKNYSWAGASPSGFIWDGKDDRKILVPDGVYFYYIESTDRAGNTSEQELSNIIINTQSTPTYLTVDASYFAPGMNDANSIITLVPDVPVKTGIESWSIKIIDKNGRTVKEYNEGVIPEQIEYDGAFQNGFIAEGEYTAEMNIRYVNGNNPSAKSPVFIADKTVPEASAKTNLRVFSPNGDGKKDVIEIYQETSNEDVWYAEITDEQGYNIKSFKWVNNPESRFTWDGYTQNGELAADGEYSYRLYTADKAGNKGESSVISFDLDTEETPVILTANPEAFSPNGDGINDRMILTPILNVKDGTKSYKLIVTNSAGDIIKSLKSEGRIKNEFIWDGFADSGRKAGDGTYRAALEVVYEKGNISTAVTRDFILDTVYPEINVEADYTLFSPDNDGKKDSITIRQSTSTEKTITGKITDSKGTLIREYFWEGTASNFKWDGTDEFGNKVADGNYIYSIEIADKAGNKTVKQIDTIEVDNRQASVFVTASTNGFTPDNDNVNDRIEFSTMTTLKNGVEKWELVIKKDGITEVKSFEGETLPEKIIWDGKNNNGRVIEGSFQAEYRVFYKKGNEPASVTKEFGIDITAPEIAVNIDPVPFSPDNDGVEDELRIKIDVEDANEIKYWSLDIVDRGGNDFTSFSGKGKPAEQIIWDGLGRNGELVIAAEDYPYRLTVTDSFNNEAVEYGVIPVDVLVVKDGDRLKIRIANITFAPDSAELKKDDPEIKAKNEYVLGRLSEILEKYNSYKILIEGHAVSVFWEDAARAQKEQNEELLPLSKARAETVKNYLNQLGIAESRMTTKGIGGSEPIVPHGDLDNRWKNRRVEFILIK